jgi:hypothetical protein
MLCKTWETLEVEGTKAEAERTELGITLNKLKNWTPAEDRQGF